MTKSTTIRIPARKYQDHEDCLAAAASDVAEDRDLSGWDLNPRWEDDQRDVILIDVPAFRAAAEDLDMTFRPARADELTVGLRDEFDRAQKDGVSADPVHVSVDYNGATHELIVLQVEGGRYGISRASAGTGDDQWTDASSLQEAIVYYLIDDMRP